MFVCYCPTPGSESGWSEAQWCPCLPGAAFGDVLRALVRGWGQV